MLLKSTKWLYGHSISCIMMKSCVSGWSRRHYIGQVQILPSIWHAILVDRTLWTVRLAAFRKLLVNFDCHKSVPKARWQLPELEVVISSTAEQSNSDVSSSTFSGIWVQQNSLWSPVRSTYSKSKMTAAKTRSSILPLFITDNIEVPVEIP